jgi:hypothetical protein
MNQPTYYLISFPCCHFHFSLALELTTTPKPPPFSGDFSDESSPEATKLRIQPLLDTGYVMVMLFGKDFVDFGLGFW